MRIPVIPPVAAAVPVTAAVEPPSVPVAEAPKVPAAAGPQWKVTFASVPGGAGVFVDGVRLVCWRRPEAA